jgi:hypothetical protein
MPLCVTLHGYRCGVETLALEVFSLLIYFVKIRVLGSKSFAFKFLFLIDIELTCRYRVLLLDVDKICRSRVTYLLLSKSCSLLSVVDQLLCRVLVDIENIVSSTCRYRVLLCRQNLVELSCRDR